MPQAPDQYQPRPTAPPQPGLGFANQPHPFWKALENVVNGLRMSSNQPAPWGMHEPTLTASQAVGPAMSGALDTMADPRNAWMGLGPIAGMARFGQGIRGGMRGMQDLGGFNVPTGDMRQALGIARPNLRAGELPNEQELRSNFLGGIKGMNEVAEALRNPQHPRYEQAKEIYSQSLLPEGVRRMNQIDQGLENLEVEKRLRFNNSSGGSQAPYFYRQ